MVQGHLHARVLRNHSPELFPELHRPRPVWLALLPLHDRQLPSPQSHPRRVRRLRGQGVLRTTLQGATALTSSCSAATHRYDFGDQPPLAPSAPRSPASWQSRRLRRDAATTAPKRRALFHRLLRASPTTVPIAGSDRRPGHSPPFSVLLLGTTPIGSNRTPSVPRAFPTGDAPLFVFPAGWTRILRHGFGPKARATKTSSLSLSRYIYIYIYI